MNAEAERVMTTRIVLAEPPDQLGAFVGRDAPRDAEQDALVRQASTTVATV